MSTAATATTEEYVPPVGDVANRLGELGLPEPASALARRRWDAVVIGAGHNGLAAAAYLARAGWRVLVLERRERVGGACTLERPFADERYLVSPCAYLVGLLDPLVISELELRRRGVRVALADPQIWAPLDDGGAVALWLDDRRTEAGLRDLGVSERDLAGIRRYGELFERIRHRLRRGERDAWIGECPGRAELEAMLGDQALVDVVFEASIAELLEAHVADRRLHDALFGQGITGFWGGPRDPGSAGIRVLHHLGDLEGRGPVWGYVHGGMGTVSFAICEAALDAGAVVACGASAARVRPGEGVELDDGTLIGAPRVICNADPKALLTLLDEAALPDGFRRRLQDWRVRSPVVKVNAALRELPAWKAAGGGTWPARGSIDLSRGVDAAQAAFEACARGEPRVGFAELYLQTAHDPTIAPPGRHVVSAFCQYAPYELAEGDWEARREGIGRQVTELVERFAPGFGALVLEAEVLGPPDIEARVGLAGGNIFQGECSPDQVWDRRLSQRTPLPGLYLCGAATHPGGSVIGLGGRNAAQAALADARAPAAASLS
jgi:phytoene dehydrogenase-like protein